MKRLAVAVTGALLLVGCHYDLLDAEKPSNTPSAPVFPRDTIAVLPRVPPVPPVRGTTAQVSPTLPPPTVAPTTSRPPVVPSTARCPEYWARARSAGWPVWALPTVDRLMYRESRCTPTARSSTRDSGLLQINDVHLVWLAEYGIRQSDLMRPKVNLRAGRLLFARAQRMFGCGWQPWGLPC